MEENSIKIIERAPEGKKRGKGVKEAESHLSTLASSVTYNFFKNIAHV